MFVFGVTLPQEYYYDNWYVGAKSSGDCNSLLSSSSISSSNIIRPYGARLVCLPVSPRMQRPHLTNPTQSQFFPGFITPALVTVCRSRRWRIWVRYITSGICHPCEKDSSSKSCFLSHNASGVTRILYLCLFSIRINFSCQFNWSFLF